MLLEISFRAESGFGPAGPLAWGSAPVLTSWLLAFEVRDVAQEKTGRVLVGEFGSRTDIGIERIKGVI